MHRCGIQCSDHEHRTRHRRLCRHRPGLRRTAGTRRRRPRARRPRSRAAGGAREEPVGAPRRGRGGARRGPRRPRGDRSGERPALGPRTTRRPARQQRGIRVATVVPRQRPGVGGGPARRHGARRPPHLPCRRSSHARAWRGRDRQRLVGGVLHRQRDVLRREGVRHGVLRGAGERARRHRRHGDGAVPGLHPHRVPPESTHPALQASARVLARRRRRGPASPRRRRGRQDRVGAGCPVEGR